LLLPERHPLHHGHTTSGSQLFQLSVDQRHPLGRESFQSAVDTAEEEDAVSLNILASKCDFLTICE